ncbi:Zn-dependent exopeptidase [Glarea lozoyensis ATCC 20868]|uniref:Peptide hydrolase n=1 Tax=Glarea lozoyensis (strain ATCC 20868 / MF5171) TaxID=1116229 RepID=S3CKJ7_GLAL2|nr:Zn-dependent exopeptidase [Glarea lozoyensis ATCC 20868]EPE27057.1 Zn-dependent exopeptidase [Glarea lozoyensis ATCC 20868]
MKFSSALSLVAGLVAISEAAPSTSVVESRALPLVQSNQLRRVLLRSELLKKGQILEDFAYSWSGRNRLIGTIGHNKTVNYLYDTLVATGYYDVAFQKFLISTPINETFTVGNSSYETVAMAFSEAGKVTAPIVKVANLGCDAADFPDLTGKIALISRGSCTFVIKASFAEAAGALGTVIYNNVSPGVIAGSGEGDFGPVLSITLTDGQALVAKLATGATVIGTMNVDIDSITTYNVIAETKGGDHNNVLMLGAHTDSVEAGPGINDNGSGSIGILEVALQLTKFSVNNAVRFGWWSGEEEGLLGATYYVENLSAAESAKIRLYMNFDMIASPNFVYQIYDGDGSSFGTSGAPGSAELEHLWEAYFPTEAGLAFDSTAFDGRSDYGPFLDAGIPAGGLTSGADEVKTPEQQAIFGGTAGIILDPNYHTAQDTLKNLNVGVWVQMTKGIAHAVATYARSWEGFPTRVTKRDASVSTVYKPTRKGGLWIS